MLQNRCFSPVFSWIEGCYGEQGIRCWTRKNCTPTCSKFSIIDSEYTSSQVHSDIDELARTHLIYLSKTPTEGSFFTRIPTLWGTSSTSFIMPLSYDGARLPLLTSKSMYFDGPWFRFEHQLFSARQSCWPRGENGRIIYHGLQLTVTHLEDENKEGYKCCIRRGRGWRRQCSNPANHCQRCYLILEIDGGDPTTA